VPTLAVSSADPASIETDVLVVGLHKGDDGPRLAPGAESVAAAWDGLAETFATLGATGAAGAVVKLPSLGKVAAPLIVAVGLGKPGNEGEFASETIRRAGGAAVRAAAGHDSVAFAIDIDADELALGAMLGGYRFAGYKSKPIAASKRPVSQITVLGTPVDTERVEALSNAVSAARDWVNTPGNLLRPPAFATRVSAAATEAGLDVEVLDEDALAEGGYGGILAVGMGSAEKPRLVRLAYRAEGASKHVALVGKGITFDTGGISIKPAAGMWDMKTDMGGAAAIAGTMLAVAALKPAVNVTAYIPMAENMPSSTAYRPGDVITAYGGKTIEVLNTDAEGRMVLCDALARAAEDNPDVIYDAATLTGGQVIGLGKRTAGVMGTEEECARVKAAGERVGELAWPMPMPEEIRKSMESQIADVSQCAAGLERSGHMLQGGIFLSHFVPEGMPWAHIDIAGPSAHSGEPYGYIVKGATGVPVRTLVALIEEHAE
jgi:leucyl aminopeptidase